MLNRWRKIVSLLTACVIPTVSSGCCTFAHSGAIQNWNDNDQNGEACPWLVGDALLLIPGIIPGVIAFIVDFSSGEWRHGNANPSSDSTCRYDSRDRMLETIRKLKTYLARFDFLYSVDALATALKNDQGQDNQPSPSLASADHQSFERLASR